MFRGRTEATLDRANTVPVPVPARLLLQYAQHVDGMSRCSQYWMVCGLCVWCAGNMNTVGCTHTSAPSQVLDEVHIGLWQWVLLFPRLHSGTFAYAKLSAVGSLQPSVCVCLYITVVAKSNSCENVVLRGCGKLRGSISYFLATRSSQMNAEAANDVDPKY